jgi:hypothetical protein
MGATHGTSQHIVSVLAFLTNKKSYFTTNSENYSMHTRHSKYLHLPQTCGYLSKNEFTIQVLKPLINNATKYQKGAHYMQELKFLIIFLLI